MTGPAHDGGAGIPFSSIRTMTVGFGMTTNLLTPLTTSAGARGLMRRCAITAGGDFHPAQRTIKLPGRD